MKERELTGSGLLDISNNVGHTSLVSHEGCELARLSLVILWEGLHCCSNSTFVLINNKSKRQLQINSRKQSKSPTH